MKLCVLESGKIAWKPDSVVDGYHGRRYNPFRRIE